MNHWGKSHCKFIVSAGSKIDTVANLIQKCGFLFWTYLKPILCLFINYKLKGQQNKFIHNRNMPNIFVKSASVKTFPTKCENLSDINENIHPHPTRCCTFQCDVEI